MSRTYRHPCGCRSTDSHWVEMCQACAAEFNERHARAQSEHGDQERTREVSLIASLPKAAPTAGGVTPAGVLSSLAAVQS